MCIQNALQQHILDITNDGKDIADFFYATMHGQNPHAQFHHQMDAAKQLRILGLHITPSPVKREGWDVGESSIHPDPVEGQPKENTPSPVTDLDIINHKVARLIREETNDGYLIAEFLTRVMRGTAGQSSPISETDRLRAARELMNRGLGRFGDTRDRRISNSQEELIHSGLSCYIRERTDHGMEPVHFLLDVASGQYEDFSMHQRVVATRELVRRGWDTNCDAVTPEDIAAYYERQDAREPTGYDIRLRQWREEQRAAQNTPREEELESGIFAHLPIDEIDRYEAMSAEEQAEFIEQQRQRRSTRPIPPSPSTGEGWDGGENSIHPDPVEGQPKEDTPSPSTREGWDGGENSIHPDPVEGQSKDNPPSPSTGDGWDGGENSIHPDPVEGQPKEDTPSPSTGEGWDGGENHENINWSALLHDTALSTRTPHSDRSHTHIRSP